MIASDELKNLLNKSEFSNTDKLLIILASDNGQVKPLAEIRNSATTNGLRATTKWNLSSLLSRSKGRAISTPDGWELTTDGRTYVASLVGPLAAAPSPRIASSLRVHLASIKDSNTRAFVEEGIECFERRLYRSAIVLTWVGAAALLQDLVVRQYLTDFNAEATRRDAKWHTAKTADDLGRMKEHDFLQIIEKISIIGKNVKQELEKQLTLRNGCGHPNTLKISENVVAAHIEILMLNVFTKFS